MNNSKQTLLSIGATLLIIALVVGGTYAYWTWTSDNNTTVSFTVSSPEISVSMAGSGVYSAANMEPTTCTNTESGNNIRETVTFTYKNPTPYPVTVTVDLVANTFTPRSGITTITQTVLGNIKWKLTESSSSCATNSSDITPVKQDFSGLTVTGGALSAPTKLGTLTFEIPASVSSNQTKTYYLYTWLDSSYAPPANVGTTINDPLQGASFTLVWNNGQASQHS